MAEQDRSSTARTERLDSAPAEPEGLQPTQQLETRADELSWHPDQPTQPAAPPGEVAPGQVLGPYRVEAVLGGGGMGKVFRAVHTAMDRVVALKVILPHLTRDSFARERFKREIRSAARLAHPNIVHAYDAVVDDSVGRCYLVMEHVEGLDVARLYRLYGRPPLAVACEIIRQAALGLQHAHELGMVHRDIKPANLILVLPGSGGGKAPTGGWPARPQVKILDFGLARLAAPPGDSATGAVRSDDVTREGGVVGTPEFMSPEQARDSRQADIRSDVYALGCTLYALLAGRPPFTSDTVFEVLTMHLRQPPPPVEQHRPDVPPGLSAVLGRMLAKNPNDRFQTPAEVAGALLPWVGVAADSQAGTAPMLPAVHLPPPPAHAPAAAPARAPAAAPAPAPQTAPAALPSPAASAGGLPTVVLLLVLTVSVAILTLLGWFIYSSMHGTKQPSDEPTKERLPD